MEVIMDGIGSAYPAQVNQFNQLHTTSFGPANYQYAQDKATNATTTIDYAHHEAHDGHSFTAQNFQITGSGAEFNLGINTPNTTTWVHAIEEVNGTGIVEFRIFEGATLSGGTQNVCINRNRNSAISPTSACYSNPTISGASPTSGTLLIKQTYGDATTPSKKAGGGGRGMQELILKSGTTYLFNLRSATDDNRISARLEWYEHADKTKQF